MTRSAQTGSAEKRGSGQRLAAQNKGSSGGKKAGRGSSKAGILSMTGYGYAERRQAGLCVQVEVRCVNHRFLDISMKLPRLYGSFESDLKKLISEEITRGRVDVYVGRVVDSRPAGRRDTKSNSAKQFGRVQLDQVLFDELCEAQTRALEASPHCAGLSPQQLISLKAELVKDVLRRQDVSLTVEQLVDQEGEQKILIETLRAALAKVREMQRAEGLALSQDLQLRISHLVSMRARILARSKVVHDNLRSKLLERVRKLSPEVVLDEARVASEVVLLADRADITEELVRLNSHLTQFAETLESEPSGKRFDFLLQEIHREFNTIGSKAQDSEMQGVMIESKVEIEKLREQVQNIA